MRNQLKTLHEPIDHRIQKETLLPNHDPPPDSQTAAIVNDHLQYMVATYVRPPPMIAKGEGCYVWDVENRRYLDFTSGIAVNSLGHCDPEVSKLVRQQVSTSIQTFFKALRILILFRRKLSFTLQISTTTLGPVLFHNSSYNVLVNPVA